ncbi:MAG: hypothetical protein K9M49_02250 [Candidatus Marinimicrobia bacterium]|nr:hypothetical protein [Candidatus Neomarinimicrobiota bacterium]MCF7903953.1 hypothetical protein [Candidatus Neomarinimicrobiota bacterium]
MHQLELGSALETELKTLNCHVITAEDTDNFVDKADTVSIPSWPEFMMHDTVANKYWSRMHQKHPQFQFALVENDSGRWRAVGNSIPVSWQGSLDELPDEGWDWAMTSGMMDSNWNMLSAIAIQIHPDFRGKRLSSLMIRIMKAIGKEAGFSDLIAPVRPNLKHENPAMNMELYVDWRDEGILHDPWLRVHEKMGARLIKVCHQAMHIVGTVKEWKEWTGMTFPATGPYIIKGALVPVNIDIEKDSGVYVEPNVWMAHKINE